MTNEIIFEVRTIENGIFSKWRFVEAHRENDYGNGNFIGVYRNGEHIATLDVRYQKYVFATLCESYIKMYYGENLLSYKRRIE